MDRVAQINILNEYVSEILTTQHYEVEADTDTAELADFLVTYYIDSAEETPEWFDDQDKAYMVERVQESLDDLKAQQTDDDDEDDGDDEMDGNQKVATEKQIAKLSGDSKWDFVIDEIRDEMIRTSPLASLLRANSTKS